MLILISRSSVDPTSIIHSFFIPNILSDFFFVLTGTNRYFSKVAAANMGIEISMVDASDLSKLKAAIKPKTKVKNFQQTIIITCYILLMNISLTAQKSHTLRVSQKFSCERMQFASE